MPAAEDGPWHSCQLNQRHAAVNGQVRRLPNGETGPQVPVRDSHSIAEALYELLDSSDQARAMGRAGYERARDLFGWPRFIRTLEGVYDRVLGHQSDTRILPSRRAA